MISDFALNQLEEAIERIVNADGLSANEKIKCVKDHFDGNMYFDEFVSWFQDGGDE